MAINLTVHPLQRLGAGFAARERDVRDTLWLLGCAVWVVIPHLEYVPLWAGIGIGALLAWRAWITLSGRQLPGRWILIVLMLVAGLGVYAQFRTIFGKDAGVAYIVLLLGLKLLEMRARRDIFVVIFLCLFVMLTGFFESQSIVMAGAMLVGLLLLVTALVSTNFVVREPGYFTKLKIAGQMCLLGLPLMIVLFVLFPRVQGPLWGMPADAFSGRTGLPDSMAPGSLSDLSQSNEVAFRVKFNGAAPPLSGLYWRGPVLGNFNGRAWRPAPQRFGRTAPLDVQADSNPAATPAIDYSVTLEAHNRPWIFLLDAPVAAPLLSIGGPAILRNDLQVLASDLIRTRIRYDARSTLRYHYGMNEDALRLRDWVQLPPGYNPRTLAFAFDLRKQETDNRRLIARVLQYFRTENFFYTLQPPTLGRNSVDEFLFDTRRGFCEHYASAFVVLMRALDLPARVVTGYQGGELNPVDGFVEVRQRDAHAWAEVWLEGEGWVRFDPTAAVAPNRIEQGASQALTQTGGIANAVRNTAWLRYMRFNWDAVGNAWNQWVLSFNSDSQRGLFDSVGIPDVDWTKLTIALIVVFGAVLTAVGSTVLVRRPKPDPVVRLYSRWCERLAGAGLARTSDEGPRDYLARIAPRLSADARTQAEDITRLYEQLRYARPDPTRNTSAHADFTATLRQFGARVRAFRATRDPGAAAT